MSKKKRVNVRQINTNERTNKWKKQESVEMLNVVVFGTKHVHKLHGKQIVNLEMGFSFFYFFSSLISQTDSVSVRADIVLP